ncbi:hypothetical protein Ancab_028384, partial [Ancistrocladus abbreviatus]
IQHRKANGPVSCLLCFSIQPSSSLSVLKWTAAKSVPCVKVHMVNQEPRLASGPFASASLEKLEALPDLPQLEFCKGWRSVGGAKQRGSCEEQRKRRGQYFYRLEEGLVAIDGRVAGGCLGHYNGGRGFHGLREGGEGKGGGKGIEGALRWSEEVLVAIDGGLGGDC